MRLIVGLGNPGQEYAATRHNLGHLLLEELCRRNGCRISRPEGRCEVGPCRLDGHEVLLARSRTWMNVSGPPVRELLEGWEIVPGEILVAHDDVDLDLGQVRLRSGGGAGGHKGVRSLMDALGTGGFARLRMGVGRPATGVDTADWVLRPFRRSERPAVEEMISRAAEAAECAVLEGLPAAMNRYNRWPWTEEI